MPLVIFLPLKKNIPMNMNAQMCRYAPAHINILSSPHFLSARFLPFPDTDQASLCVSWPHTDPVLMAPTPRVF